jgi:hypothetical protein
MLLVGADCPLSESHRDGSHAPVNDRTPKSDESGMGRDESGAGRDETATARDEFAAKVGRREAALIRITRDPEA